MTVLFLEVIASSSSEIGLGWLFVSTFQRLLRDPDMLSSSRSWYLPEPAFEDNFVTVKLTGSAQWRLFLLESHLIIVVAMP